VSRRWLFLGLVAIATMTPSFAEAGRGRRVGNHYNMTPYGPMPGGVSMQTYEQMVEQRQLVMQQQRQYQQQQALNRQYLRGQKAQQKGKKGSEPLVTLQPQPNRGIAARKKARTKGATAKAETLIGTSAKTDTTKATAGATTKP
jgi:hypothetical protein